MCTAVSEVNASILSTDARRGVCDGDRRFSWSITNTLTCSISNSVINGVRYCKCSSKDIIIDNTFVKNSLLRVYDETESAEDLGVWGSFRTGPASLSIWPFGTKPIWISNPYTLLTSSSSALQTSDPGDAFDTYPVLHFCYYHDGKKYYLRTKYDNTLQLLISGGAATITIEYLDNGQIETKVVSIPVHNTWYNLELFKSGTLIRSLAVHGGRWMGLSLDTNPIKNDCLVSKGSLTLHTTGCHLIAGGHIDMHAPSGIHYMFSGVRWIDTSNQLESNGCLGQGAARYAVYGFKNQRWLWLGTCSMNNSGITVNSQDESVPTVALAYEWMPPPSGVVGSSHTVVWRFSQNIDTYSVYRVKHVRQSGHGEYQASDCVSEIEFF